MVKNWREENEVEGAMDSLLADPRFDEIINGNPTKPKQPSGRPPIRSPPSPSPSTPAPDLSHSSSSSVSSMSDDSNDEDVEKILAHPDLKKNKNNPMFKEILKKQLTKEQYNKYLVLHQ